MFAATLEERKRYAGYSTEVQADSGRVTIKIIDGVVYRMAFRFYREPSTRRFILKCCTDATDHERSFARGLVHLMPEGYWAFLSGSDWFRFKSKNGRIAYRQLGGLGADDPLAQLELEMMIDNTRELSVV